MVLPEGRNRRLSKNSKFKSVFCILSIFSGITIVTVLVYFGLIRLYSTKEETLPLSINETEFGDYANEQTALVQQLKDDFLGKLSEPYMQTNSFFRRWLKANNWNLEKTKNSLTQHLEWREEYQLDGISNEDFNQSAKEYKFYSDGFDKTGRPVFTCDVAGLDLRKIALSGKGKRFLRYIYREFEIWMEYARILEIRGDNIPQGIIILNMYNLNMNQHLCYLCIPYIVKLILAWENYPGMICKIIVINAPEEFNLLLDFTPETLEKVLEVYGANQAIWKAAVLNLISPDQIRPGFGGTKVTTDTDY